MRQNRWPRSPGTVVVALIFLQLAGDVCGDEAATPQGEPVTDAKANVLDLDESIETEDGFKITPIPLILPLSDPVLGYGAAGGGMALIRKPHENGYLGPDSVIPPDLFIIGGFKTSNESEGILGRYKGHWFGDRVQTDTVVGGGTLNLSFFGSDGGLVALENRGGLTYTADGALVKQDLGFRLGESDSVLGIGYNYVSVDNTFDLPIIANGFRLGPYNTSNAALGPYYIYDSRNHRWSPTEGHFFSARLNFFNDAFGGHFDYPHLRLNSLNYWELPGPWSIGVRLEGQFTGDDAPFYALPSVKLRGTGIRRYQGNHTLLTEVEVAYQFAERWRAVAFGGLGSAADEFGDLFDDDGSVLTGGVGIRWRAIQKKGIDVGVDVAQGQEETTVLFQFGSSWRWLAK